MTARLAMVVGWGVVAGIAAQALLAGQGWFQDPSLISLHGGIGHGVLGLAVILVGLTVVGRLGWGLVALAGLQLVGLIGQTGMGYAGRRSGIATASALHIPLGVLLFGLSVALVLLLSLRASQGAGTADDATADTADAPA